MAQQIKNPLSYLKPRNWSKLIPIGVATLATRAAGRTLDTYAPAPAPAPGPALAPMNAFSDCPPALLACAAPFKEAQAKNNNTWSLPNPWHADGIKRPTNSDGFQQMIAGDCDPAYFDKFRPSFSAPAGSNCNLEGCTGYSELERAGECP